MYSSVGVQKKVTGLLLNLAQSCHTPGTVMSHQLIWRTFILKLCYHKKARFQVCRAVAALAAEEILKELMRTAEFPNRL